MLILSLAVITCSSCVAYGLHLQRKILIEQRNHTELLSKIEELVRQRNSNTYAVAKAFNEMEPPKMPPANRKPRTEEQKRLASEQRKAYWEKKRQEKMQQSAASLQTSAQAINS